MSIFKKDISLQELGKIEAQKKEQRHRAEAEIEALNARRSELLAEMEGEVQPALPELEKNAARISHLKLEIESIDAFLRTIPARKDYALGSEIETSIPGIERKAAEIPAMVADINKKAAALIAANNKLFDFLGEFDDLKATQSLELKSTFWGDGFNTLRNFGSIGGVASDNKPLDVDIILMGSVYDKDRLSAWLDKVQSSVVQRIERMRDHARQLKGEGSPESPWVYCPKCYEMASPTRGNNYRCLQCGYTFSAAK